MDARTVEMVAAALGHEPPSDLRRQVLAGLGPAHTAHLVAQTQAADNVLCATAHKPLNVVYIFMLYRLFKYWILRRLSILDAT
jgi:hypothetical protein